MKRVYYCLLIILLLYSLTAEGGIQIYRFPTEDNIAKSKLSAPSEDSHPTHSQTVMPTEFSSANITWKIINPKRDGGFFNESNEVIVVLAKVTSLQKAGLKNLEIWQILEDGLKLDNCSYPIRTSNIREILDYELSDKSLLQDKDIINISSIKNKFVVKERNRTNPHKIYSHIFSLLSIDTQKLIYNSTNSPENERKLRIQILRDFNGIINNKTNKDLNVTHFMHAETVHRTSTLVKGSYKGIYQGFGNHSKSFLEMKDYRLFKRRLLEDAFPEGIKRIPYYKEHEDYKIDANSNIIKIGKKEIGTDLAKGESVVFKYYLRPEKLGETELRAIIRAEGFLYEGSIPLKIVEREPMFEVEYLCPSKELIKDEINEFEYYVRYLGGDEYEKFFNISINPAKDLETNEAYCIVDPCEIKNYMFSKGKTESFKVNVTYLRGGYRLSPPTISIGDKEEKFEADISVYDKDDKPAKMHYESLALGYQKESNDIAWWLMWLSAISIFILCIEVYYVVWEMRQAKADRKEHTGTLNKLSDTLENILNKI